MIKDYINQICTFLIGMVIGGMCVGSYLSHNYTMPTAPEKEIEYIYIETEPIIETVYVPYEEPFYRNFTEEDKKALLDIAMREAEGEDAIGQCWVMYTVICRAEAFGKSIPEIVSSDAFKTSRSRAGKTPNENCLKAFALIEEGWQPRPLYFRANTYHGFGTPLCRYGNHFFSTK